MPEPGVSGRSLSFQLWRGVEAAVSRLAAATARGASIPLRELARRQGFRPRADDLYVAAYPKSGTTLMQMMLHQLLRGSDVDFPHLDAVSPWWEMAVLEGATEALEAAPAPRLLKTHLCYEDLPAEGRIVIIARQVRDVAISSYHHHAMELGFEPDLESFLDAFLAGDLAFGSWFDHLASWWPRCDDDRVCFVTFEGVTADPEGALRRLAAFCGVELDEGRLPAMLDNLSIASMRRRNALFDPRRRRLSGVPESPFLYGEPGGGADLRWSEPSERDLDRRLRGLLERLGDSPELGCLLRAGETASPVSAASPAPPPAVAPPSGAPARRGGLLGRLQASTAYAERALRRKLAVAHRSPPRPDDVVLASYPGSGHPLLQLMLFALVRDEPLEELSHIESFSPWWEFLVHGGHAERLEGFSSPRFLRTHLLRENVPPGRAVYLLRDPRQVAAAWFHQERLRRGFDGDFDAFVARFVRRGLPLFGSWFAHTASWWPHRQAEGVLFLTWDRVVGDPAGTLRALAAFCGLELDDARLPALVERCRPAVLEAHRDRFDPRLRQLDAARRTFVRRGQSGDGQGVFSPSQEARLTKRLRALAARLDPARADPPARRLLGLLE